MAAKLASAEGEEGAELRRRLAQVIRELVVVVRFFPDHIDATFRRRITKGMKVLPRFVDGKAVPEWEATSRSSTSDRLRRTSLEAQEALQFVADIYNEEEAAEIREGRWPFASRRIRI